MAKNQIVIFYLSIFSYAVRFLEESAHTGKLSGNTMVLVLVPEFESGSKE